MEGRITEYHRVKDRVVVTLELKPCELIEYQDKDLDIDIKVHRKKKSNNANGYAWHLMQEMAEALKSDKWSVYIDMLVKYSNKFVVVTLANDEIADSMKKMVRAYVDLGKDAQGRPILQLYEGTSGFDSKEYSIFLDGICQECKDLGIPTITPREIAMLEGIKQ